MLIHEATFDDELQGDAKAKKHSTTSEALGVGLAMRARRVVLTHFSQRYQRIPVMESVDVDKVMLEDAEDQELDVSMPTVGLSEDVTVDEAVVDNQAFDTNEARTDLQNIDNTAIPGAPGEETTNLATAWTSVQPMQQYSEPSVVGGVAPSPSRRRSASVDRNFSSAAKGMKICIAFDYMKFKVGEIEYMEKLTPALLELYQTAGSLDGKSDKDAVRSAHMEANKEAKRDEARKKKKSNEEINRGSAKKGKRERRNETPKEKRDKSGKEALRAKSPNEEFMKADNIKAAQPDGNALARHVAVASHLDTPGSSRFSMKREASTDENPDQQASASTPTPSPRTTRVTSAHAPALETNVPSNTTKPLPHRPSSVINGELYRHKLITAELVSDGPTPITRYVLGMCSYPLTNHHGHEVNEAHRNEASETEITTPPRIFKILTTRRLSIGTYASNGHRVIRRIFV